MRRYRKSVVMPLALFIYTTIMAVYFIPRNEEMSDTRKWLTVGVSYAIIALLWWVLRKKEQMVARKEEQIMKEINIKNKK